MKHLFTFLLFILFSSIVTSQSIWTNPITGTNPNSSNPYTIGQTVNANISASGIGRGSGILGNGANNRYNANSWNTVSKDETAYYYFTLTPNTGYKINFTSFVYNGQASGTGPNSFEFSSSIDGYSTSIGSPTATGTTIDLSAAAFQNITTEITFRIYAWGASMANGTFSINDFTFNGAAPLPVTFSKFTATSAKNTSILSFATASETNNDFFTIERSTDGRDYDAIGEIKGAGNSNNEITYEFTDEKPFVGINYYRIKQTDYDGKYSYSDIKSVRHTTAGNLSITPRTTEGRLQVTTDMEDYAIVVYNVAGQQVKSFKSLSFDQLISIDDLTAGLYYVKVNFGGQVETIKVVKI